MIRHKAGFKFAVMLCSVLALAACKKGDTGGDLKTEPFGTPMGGGPIKPGSLADFEKNVGDRVFFIVDQSNLTPEATDTLSKQAAWLKQYANVTVQVEGHSDERGTREYNIALSARRATAAREFLISNGIDARRISSIAYGKERPAALCDAESCWAQNRRAVTVIMSGAN